jgi:type II secretory ATPase GspE/PulE/Tfp pilus assembly ATPase PilB-like protein
LTTLRTDGWRKALLGITSIEEVNRITKPDFLS